MTALAPDFKAVFEALPGQVVLLGVDAPFYKVLAISEEWLKTTGQQREQVLGKSIWELYPASLEASSTTGHARLSSSLQQVLASKQPAHLPAVRYQVPVAGGGVAARYGAAHSKPVLDAAGEVRYLLHTRHASTIDADDRVQTKNVLHEREQLAFLLQVSDALRPLTDSLAVQATATRLLGEHLGVDRAYYIDIDEGAQQFVVACDWHLAHAPSHARRYPLGDWAMPWLLDGRPWVCHDVDTDPVLPDEQRAAYRGNHIRAAVVVPLVKQGQLAATFVANQNAPRAWTAQEVASVEEVAERIWGAVERARVQEALRASEQKLAAVFEALPVGVGVHDAHGTLVLANSGMQRYLPTGIMPSRDDARHMRWRALHPDGRPLDRTEFPGARAMRGEKVVPGVEMQYTPDHGPAVWTQVSAVPLLDGAGQVSGQVTVVIDITARQQAEQQVQRLLASLEAQVAERTQALQVSHHRLNTIFEAVPLQLGYYEAVRAADGQVVDLRAVAVNAASATKMALPDAASGLLMSAQLPGLRELPVWHTMTQVMATGQPQRLELRHEFGDQPVWFDVLYTRLDDGLISASLDITARKLMEQALRASQELLQLVFDTSPMAILVQEAVRDAHGAIQDFRVVLLNQELARELGRPDLVGKHCAQEYPGLKANGLFDVMRTTVETGEQQHLEYFYPHAGGNRWFSCLFVKLNDGLMALNQDITPRKQAEEEQLRHFALLQQSEEVAGLGSWDYNLATGAFRWSDGMYRLFGLPLGTPVTPHVYLDVVLAEDRPLAEQLVRQLLHKPGRFELQLRVRVGGQVKTLQIRAEVLRDAAGQPERMLGVDLDISQVQHLEAENLRLRLTRQQQLFEAVQQAQETERKRIAEGLHNGVGQLLYATKLRLDQLHALGLATDPALAAAHRETAHLLAEAIRQTRALSHELVPASLEEFGLAAALQDICRQLSTPQLALRCHLVLDAAVPPLPPLMQLALYRMAQELGLNIVKHAHGATEASLELETMPGFVLLRAEDNGPGFASGPAAGLGLRTIRDRVALLNGTLDYGHQAEFGTFVRLRLPLPASPPA